MDVVEPGVTVDSPTTPSVEAQPTPGQAPSQPGAEGPQPQQRMIPLDSHIAERRAWQRREQEYQRQLQELQRPPQPAQSDEDRELKNARDAFYGKVAPELKDVPQLLQGLAQERFVSSGERMIESFATKHGLTAADLSNTLASIIQNDPALMARASRGDVSLVASYLKGLEPVVAALKAQSSTTQRHAAAAIGQTKLTTTQLPTPGASTLPGEPAAKPLEPGKEREYRRDMHSDARRMLRELTTQG